MIDRPSFEVELGEAFLTYVADAPVDVDPLRVAAAAASGARVRRRRTVDFDRARLVLPIAATFVVLSIVGTAAFVGSDRAPRSTPLPSSSPAPSASAPGSSAAITLGVITPASDMSIARRAPIAVVLSDGRVLVAGGGDQTQGQASIPADVFDPSTGRFTPIAGDGPTGDGGGSAVLLPNGRVLLIIHNLNETASRAYVFDPVARAFRRLAADRPANSPVFGVDPSLALLNDGRVLIAGGRADVYKADLLASAQLFDPTAETFTATGSMSVARYRHAMATLADGRVLIAGGEGRIDFDPVTGEPVPPDDLASAEIYDPSTGAFTPTGGMSKVRGATLAAPLPDGRVVVMPHRGPFSEWRVAVGQSAAFDWTEPVPVEIFEPRSDAFLAADPAPRAASAETIVLGGAILVTGVIGEAASASPLETWAAIHDLRTGVTEPATAPRAWFATPVTLADGRVAFFGGMNPVSDNWPGDAVPWVDLYR